jgi:hypothetical protein
MKFAEAWDTFAVGDSVKVSDGTPPPNGKIRFNMWRSHNFTGVITDKIPGDWRAMQIEVHQEDIPLLAYRVEEYVDHNFEALEE